jgi:hypothetical protein
MSNSTSASGTCRAMAAAATLAWSAACARPAHPTPDSAQPIHESRTVFTDSSLFRKVCAEADSALGPKSGRCTPRDQAAPAPVRPKSDP